MLNIDKMLGAAKKKNKKSTFNSFDKLFDLKLTKNKMFKGASIKKQKQWKSFSPMKKMQMRKTFLDWDKDGVPNKWDCQPRNPLRQDSENNLQAKWLKEDIDKFEEPREKCQTCGKSTPISEISFYNSCKSCYDDWMEKEVEKSKQKEKQKQYPPPKPEVDMFGIEVDPYGIQEEEEYYRDQAQREWNSILSDYENEDEDIKEEEKNDWQL